MIGKKYLSQQIDEIESDQTLKIFGFFLILIHFLTALFWYQQDFTQIIRNTNESICWPFFAKCELVKTTLLPVSQSFLPIYAIVSILALVFYQQKAKRIWISIFVLEIIKIFFQALDYRFMGNYHFMPHFVTIFYLFLPAKKFWAKTWIISFYFAAATLKFNFEWLSGAALSWRIPFNNQNFLVWGAFAALFTEITAPQFLLFPQKWVKQLGFVILLIFHLLSYYWVGFFYPLVMLSLLAIFVLDWKNNKNTELLKKKLFDFHFLIGLGVLLIFFLSQVGTLLNYRERALGSQERLFSLNMFDARSVCRGFFIIKKPEILTEVDFQNQDLAARVKCDPIVFFEQARHLCQGSLNPLKVDAYLSSRLMSDYLPSEIVKEEDICRRWL